MKKAIYPGSFDPITNGHLDVIERAANLFDEVVVVVMTNYRKKGNMTFTESERAELIKKAIADIPNVRVDTYDGLLADYARDHDICFAVKGLRAVSDFEDEFQQAIGNRHLNNNLETVFMSTDQEDSYLSSSTVREVARYNGDVSKFVPESIAKNLYEKFGY